MIPSAPIAWRHSLRTVGLWGCLSGFVAIALLASGQETPDSPFPFANAARAVEATLPLLIGIQAAFLFSPDDDPALEVLLACPRPAWWMLLERLLVLWALMWPIGLLYGVLLEPHNPFSAAVRWIPPALFFSGIAAFTTLRGRQPAFSLIVLIVLWFVATYFGFALLPGFPAADSIDWLQNQLWLIHPYPHANDLSALSYLINRLSITAIGLGLLLLSCADLRHSEWLLFSRKGTV